MTTEEILRYERDRYERKYLALLEYVNTRMVPKEAEEPVELLVDPSRYFPPEMDEEPPENPFLELSDDEFRARHDY